MKQHLLFDTDVLIDYLKKNTKAVNFLEHQVNHNLYVSSITVAELFTGARSPEEETMLERFLESFTTLDINHSIAKLAGTYLKHYRKSHNTGLADACIAATADYANARLITLNTKHFPMLKLKPPYTKH